MKRNKNLNKSLKKFSKDKASVVEELYGELGIPLGGSKIVDVPTRPGYVYVRLKGNTSELIQAYNNSVPNVYNYPVRVRRSLNTYTVVGKDQSKWSNLGNGSEGGSASPLPRHGGQHSLNPAAGMGADTSWIYSRQFMNQLAYPSGTTSMMLTLEPHFYEKDGQWAYSQNTGTPSFAPYVPTVTGSARMALLYLNKTNNALEIVAGALFSGGVTNPATLAGYIPDVDRSYGMPLAAVKLTSGTSYLTWDNVYDMRDFYTVQKGWNGIGIQDEGIPLGTGSTLNFTGAGVTASISGSVVRVDVSAGGSANPPITGSVVFQNESVTLGSVLKLNVVGDQLHAWQSGDTGMVSGSHNIATDIMNAPLTNGMDDFNEAYFPFVSGTTLGRIEYALLYGSIYAAIHASDVVDFVGGTGWIPINNAIWTFESADAPSYRVRVTNSLLTGTVNLGMKIQLSHLGATKNFIITAHAATGTTSWVNLYGGTDYTLTTGSITGAKYSFGKSPYGFDTDPGKWTVSVVTSDSPAKASPTASTWYGGSGLTPSGTSIDLPIGVWNVEYHAIGDLVVTLGAVAAIGSRVTLSTANNSESDPELTSTALVFSPAGVATQRSTYLHNKKIAVTARTTYYLNIFTGVASSTSLTFNAGGAFRSIIKAVCAYL